MATLIYTTLYSVIVKDTQKVLKRYVIYTIDSRTHNIRFYEVKKWKAKHHFIHRMPEEGNL